MSASGVAHGVEVVLPAQRDEGHRLALEAAALGTWRWDATTGRTVWDAQLERVFGLPPGGFDGTFDTWVSLLHPDDRDHVLATLRRAAEERTAYVVQHRAVWPDGTVHWVEGRGKVTVDQDGEVTGSIGCAADVTARVETAARLARLQQATEDVAAAWTVDAVVAAVGEHARLAVDASSGAVALPDEGGTTLSLTGAFGGTVHTQARFGPFDVAADLPVSIASRTGEALFFDTLDEVVSAHPLTEPMTVRSTSRAVACVPVGDAAAGPTAVLVVGRSTDRPWSDGDRALLAALARQCGVGLERARLLEQSRRVAEQLQAGLVPRRVPHVDGLEVQALYRPGGRDAEQIGGDWYDVLPQPDGSVLLVIGDVMGRGIDAAATMARLSSAVRAFASVDPDPVAVLRMADRFARVDAPDDMVTLLLAHVHPRERRLRLLSAGHLPVLLLGPGAAHELIGVDDSPPLGLADADRAVRTVDLPRGAALLLTTDGLVERPGVDLDDALEDLGRTAATHLGSGAALRDVLQALGAEPASDRPPDDITVLLARLV